MTITVDYVVALNAWIDRAPNEDERAKRADRVRAQLFPPDLDEGEIAKRAAIVEQAREARDPMPLPKAPLVERVMPVPPLWGGLVRRDSPAYRRASLHDGTARAVERTRERSRGSPFDAERKGKSR